jgi:hypothetical protein
METKRNKMSLFVIMFMALTAITIAGCSKDSSLPTGPVEPTVSAFGRMPAASDVANFAVNSRTVTVDEPLWFDANQPEYTIGYFVDPNLQQLPIVQMNAFWVYLSRAGQYLLTYETMYGTFYILFEQSAPGSIAIFLHPRDIAYNITIATGMITGTMPAAANMATGNLPVVWEQENTKVYGQLPYLYTFPDGLFTPQVVTPLLINLLPPPWVGLCPPPPLDDCDPWN